MINLLQLISKKETKKEGLEKYASSLREKIEIHIPSTYDVNQKISEEKHKKIVDRIMINLTLSFGGATAIPAYGSYESQEKGVIFEGNTIVYSYVSEITKEVEEKIVKIAKELKEELKQECILVVVNGKPYFVD